MSDTGCRCVLCHDCGDQDQRDSFDLDTISNVQRHGWSVLMIPEDDQGPGWAYTIGLWHSHRMPELAMFGLDIHVMHACLNHLGNTANTEAAVASGQARHDVVETYPVHLKTIDHRWYRAFFGAAIAFYRRPPIPFLQVVWPDRDGRFPWDSGRSQTVEQRQPQLWLQPGDHPAGVWTQDV